MDKKQEKEALTTFELNNKFSNHLNLQLFPAIPLVVFKLDLEMFTETSFLFEHLLRML